MELLDEFCTRWWVVKGLTSGCKHQCMHTSTYEGPMNLGHSMSKGLNRDLSVHKMGRSRKLLIESFRYSSIFFIMIKILSLGRNLVQTVSGLSPELFWAKLFVPLVDNVVHPGPTFVGPSPWRGSSETSAGRNRRASTTGAYSERRQIKGWINNECSYFKGLTRMLGDNTFSWLLLLRPI